MLDSNRAGARFKTSSIKPNRALTLKHQTESSRRLSLIQPIRADPSARIVWIDYHLCAQPDYCNEEWVQELHAGVEKMSLKLQKYYTRTNLPSAYSDSCILEPTGKLLLFQHAG